MNPFLVVIAVLAAFAGAYLLARPRMMRWGASTEEIAQELKGDGLVPHPLLATTRAITIRASAAKVWPWLVQMGQGRGGFYSYDWLENLAGMDIHNADRIVPELQVLKVGDLIPFWRGAGVKVAGLEAEKILVLGGSLNPAKDNGGEETVGGTWVFALSPEGQDACRLIVRSRIADFPPRWLAWPMMHLLMLPMHFIMERKMMLGIKLRSERTEKRAGK
ncbi:MAG: hypothetical protein WD751_02935 [Anaerolineales bacterium]